MSQCAPTPTVLFLFDDELLLLNQLNSDRPVIIVVVVPTSSLKVGDHGTTHQFSPTLPVSCYYHALRQSLALSEPIIFPSLGFLLLLVPHIHASCERDVMYAAKFDQTKQDKTRQAFISMWQPRSWLVKYDKYT